MDNTKASEFMGAVRQNLNFLSPDRAFSPAAHDLASLYIAYSEFHKSVAIVKSSATDASLLQKLESITHSVENGMELLIEAIEQVTNRKIAVYVASESDNIFQIARRFNADLRELFELNKTNKLFSIEENKPVLVPQKV